MSLKNNPLLAAVKPLARQYVSADNMARVFASLTEGCDLGEGQKAVLLVSRGADGVVYGGVYAVDGQNRVVRQFSRQPVEELLTELLA